jgi:hypothetical protein
MTEDSQNRLADVMEEFLDRVTSPPVVHVAAPTVNVNPPGVHVAAPTVNVSPVGPEKTSWIFNIQRDGEGRITSVIANPT